MTASADSGAADALPMVLPEESARWAQASSFSLRFCTTRYRPHLLNSIRHARLAFALATPIAGVSLWLSFYPPQS